MLDVRTELSSAVRSALAAIGVGDEVEPAVEASAKPEFGDWSTPAALRSARVLRKAPMAIAEELATALREESPPWVAQWSVSPPGYVNAHLNDSLWATAVLDAALALDPITPLLPPPGHFAVAGRTLVEHTATNPNKAAHVGHLRNACLGDTVSRILRRTGAEVEVQNYIDDTGVQVADVAVGMQELGIAQEGGEPFDQYCSRVYVEICRRYESQPELLEHRRAVLHEIESGNNDTSSFVKELASKIVECHLQTMERFDIAYDLLAWESDIIALGFWRQAFELLRDQRTIVKVGEGKNNGCWVMPDGDGEVNSDAAKVLVKSDGVATYTGKDIAYQLWKFGLLGRDFGYQRWTRGEHGDVFTTTSTPGTGDASKFGRANRVINVIDTRQSYPQEIVKQALARLGHDDQAQQSVHLAYGTVVLSAAAAVELGIEVEAGKDAYAFSGRRGIEVRADELLDRATLHISVKAREVATERGVAVDNAATALVAAGAVRYYLQKFTLNQIISFDFDEALRTTGDTGVYLQFAHARTAGILRKVPDDGQPVTVTSLHPAERALLHLVDGYRHALAEASVSLAPSDLCTYAFSLASALSEFIDNTPAIVREQDADVRRFRRRLVAATKTTLADVLHTLGIDAPEHI